jgi:hypothetical protein
MTRPATLAIPAKATAPAVLESGFRDGRKAGSTYNENARSTDAFGTCCGHFFA